ncbi:MAG: nucleoside triphosphate pyrophosphohydrolase [Hyphomicrobiales bacterium]|nr:nucleoside triphosphate pyrophosphohydrolase [Hyphomicrobiales bacterium]
MPDDHADLSPMDRLLAIMARLRDPRDGCPWDVEQTFATIAPYTIEEAYEVAHAIQDGDMDELRGELGDLLLQVVFHARMAEEAGHFDFADVATAISDKMVDRHPHVFADARERDTASQTVAWEDQKAAERRDKAAARGEEAGHSALDGVIQALPALMRAEKLQKRAARVGFDWPDSLGPLRKVHEEVAELEVELASGETGEVHPGRVRDEVGDLLFSVVNLARKLHVDPETALRDANFKFETRFRRVEELLARDGLRPEDATLEDMDALWNRAKEDEER